MKRGDKILMVDVLFWTFDLFVTIGFVGLIVVFVFRRKEGT